MDTSKICYIVGGGADYGLPFTPGEHDLVIAADAGFRSLDGCGIPADYIIGDFDSLDYIPQSLNVIRLSPEKDMTDMSAAVDISIYMAGQADASTTLSPTYSLSPASPDRINRAFCSGRTASSRQSTIQAFHFGRFLPVIYPSSPIRNSPSAYTCGD